MTTHDEKRSRPIPIRFSDSERQLLGDAAAAEHDYLSSYIRRIVLTETERRMRKTRTPEMANV